MKNAIQINNTTPSVRTSIGRPPLRRGFLPPALALAITLAWFALSHPARAVTPPPGGGYPGDNTALGDNALFNLDTSQGTDNTGTGFQALLSNTTGVKNTAIGSNALFSNTTGFSNTANGVEALFSNTTGGNNTANGDGALYYNSTGSYNTANGFQALYFNLTGGDNTANGFEALYFNLTGGDNTANGFAALFLNTTGGDNTADGRLALYFNTTGNSNTANGEEALVNNTTGSNNTASGYTALNSNTTGNSNIALGAFAGFNLTTGSNNIEIGNRGAAGDANIIRLGKPGTQRATFVAGISGATVAGGVGVIIDANGHLGTVVSSERFKDAINPMDKASEAILALQPVTFRYKHELDPDGIPQFGLVAEQVEKVNPDLVARDDHGKPYTVRYEAVNAMLLNEFLKEHRKVEEQGAEMKMQRGTIEQLKSAVATLQSGIEKQAEQLQKVSARLATDKPALRVVVNEP